MIKYWLVIFVAINSVCSYAQNSSGFLPIYTDKNLFTSDIVLLYQQGYQDEQLTRNNLYPYIVYENAGKERKEWLFDGFLLLTAIDNEGFQYTNVGKSKSATKSEWEKIIKWNFKEDQAIDAINKIIDEVGDEIGDPLRKRKIFLSIPEPIKTTNAWGILNGKLLNFNNHEDRVAACKWFISRTQEEWSKLSPDNLELAGYYWTTEYLADSKKLLKEIKSTLNEKKLKLIWIPYWGVSNASLWKEFEIDATYIQPNYFFSPDLSIDRFEDVCSYAYRHGMGLEFEFDKKLFENKSVFLPRFNAYIRAFIKFNVFFSASIAYYQNGLTLKSLSISGDSEYRDLYDSLSTYILLRQRIVDNIYLGIK